MAGEQDYDINLDDKFGSLALIDLAAEIAAHEPWFNQTLTTVNDAVVRLGIIEGDFHWHKHDEEDEFFLVLEGRLLIDLEDRETVTLERPSGLHGAARRHALHPGAGAHGDPDGRARRGGADRGRAVSYAAAGGPNQVASASEEARGGCRLPPRRRSRPGGSARRWGR